MNTTKACLSVLDFFRMHAIIKSLKFLLFGPIQYAHEYSWMNSFKHVMILYGFTSICICISLINFWVEASYFQIRYYNSRVWMKHFVNSSKFYGWFNDLVCPYVLSLSQMISEMFQDNCKAVFVHWFWRQIAPFRPN